MENEPMKWRPAEVDPEQVRLALQQIQFREEFGAGRPPVPVDCLLISAARYAIEKLQAKTAVTIGVGDGSGQLFVHGDHDSIKAVQALALDYGRLCGVIERLNKDIEFLTNRNTLDTPERVCFYEQNYYVLSNFSSFRVQLCVEDGDFSTHGRLVDFMTSEHAYHYFKFTDPALNHVRLAIMQARSAHEAFKIAEGYKNKRRPDWDDVKFRVMRAILWRKQEQHEYVRRKLLETGDRELVENSWRDPVWGWGENRDGLNMLGKIWMEIRAELLAQGHKP